MAWISVNDRLPEVDNGDYLGCLLYTSSGEYYTGYYCPEDGNWFQECNWLDDEYLATIRDVTHWQLLPDEPAPSE